MSIINEIVVKSDTEENHLLITEDNSTSNHSLNRQKNSTSTNALNELINLRESLDNRTTLRHSNMPTSEINIKAKSQDNQFTANDVLHSLKIGKIESFNSCKAENTSFNIESDNLENLSTEISDNSVVYPSWLLKGNQFIDSDSLSEFVKMEEFSMDHFDDDEISYQEIIPDHSYAKIPKYRKKYTIVDDETRLKIINSIESGTLTMRKVSRDFRVTYSTVTRIYREYCMLEKTEALKRGGHKKSKLSLDDVKFVKNVINDNCHITLREIQRKVKSERNISISISSLHRHVRGFNYSIKRIDTVPETGTPSPEVENRRREYCEALVRAETEERALVFFSETSFQISMKRNYERSEPGKPAVPIIRRLKTRNKIVTAAVYGDRLLHYKVHSGADDTVTPQSSIRDLLDTIDQKQMSGVTVVMDPSFLQKFILVSTLIAERGHALLVLPPHSSCFNPVENFFSQWKDIVQSIDPSDESELIDTIGDFQNIITKSQCINYQGRAMGSVTDCLQGFLAVDQ